jgi:hypothetical protein
MTTTAMTAAPTKLARGARIGLGLALVASLAIFVLGNLGAPIRVVTGWSPDGADLTVGEVVIVTIVAVALGSAALFVLDRFRADGFRTWAVAALVVTAASIPPLWGLDVDTGSKLALSAMHVAVGLAVVAGQGVARRG